MAGYGSIYRADLFANQVILVTGGATGIGKCVAVELATLGATVVIASRKEEHLKSTQEMLRRHNLVVDYVVMDIRNEDQVEQAIESVLKRHGKLDGLVNGAGGQFLSAAEDISTKGWQSVIGLNLNGTWNVTRKAYDLYMRDHGGVIVNIIADMWYGHSPLKPPNPQGLIPN